MDCLRNAHVDVPDAVIAATGLGCLEDTEKFLGSIYQLKERLLNPTPFINSTHNTIAGAIALAVKCHGYNTTYSHRGSSFGSGIQDAVMLSAENPGFNILAGAFDEITPTSYEITRRLGLWKMAIPGEGVAFFLISDRSEKAQCLLNGISTISYPDTPDALAKAALEFMEKNGLEIQHLDLVLTGMYGNNDPGGWYGTLKRGIFRTIPIFQYKQLCGEYDTSDAFAMGLASNLISKGEMPGWMNIGEKIPGEIKNILIYNHQRGMNHTFYHLSAC